MESSANHSVLGAALQKICTTQNPRRSRFIARSSLGVGASLLLLGASVPSYNVLGVGASLLLLGASAPSYLQMVENIDEY